MAEELSQGEARAAKAELKRAKAAEVERKTKGSYLQVGSVVATYREMCLFKPDQDGMELNSGAHCRNAIREPSRQANCYVCRLKSSGFEPAHLWQDMDLPSESETKEPNSQR